MFPLDKKRKRSYWASAPRAQSRAEVRGRDVTASFRDMIIDSSTIRLKEFLFCCLYLECPHKCVCVRVKILAPRFFLLILFSLKNI